MGKELEKGLEMLLSKLEKEELMNSNSTLNYYRSHPFSKKRLEQVNRYKLQYQNVPIKEQQLSINNNIISIKYIKNKINAYNVDPYQIIKNSENKDDFLSNYSLIIALYRIGKYDAAIKKLKIIICIKIVFKCFLIINYFFHHSRPMIDNFVLVIIF